MFFLLQKKIIIFTVRFNRWFQIINVNAYLRDFIWTIGVVYSSENCTINIYPPSLLQIKINQKHFFASFFRFFPFASFASFWKKLFLVRFRFSKLFIRKEYETWTMCVCVLNKTEMIHSWICSLLILCTFFLGKKNVFWYIQFKGFMFVVKETCNIKKVFTTNTTLY